MLFVPTPARSEESRLGIYPLCSDALPMVYEDDGATLPPFATNPGELRARGTCRAAAV